MRSKIKISDNIILHPDYDYRTVAIPDSALDCGGMVSVEERSLLFYLTKEKFTGEGKIVDGGSFFGSTAVAMANGLRGNDAARERIIGPVIEAYEFGHLPPPPPKSNKENRHRNFGGVHYNLGDDFIPILTENIAPYSDLVTLNVGDLNDKSWGATPIELCFLDVCKNVRLNQKTVSMFFGKLIPGKSVVVNQDFFYSRLPWIKITMGYLSEYFEWLGQVNTSSIYRLKTAIPEDMLTFDPVYGSSLDDMIAWHETHPRDETSSQTKIQMAISRAFAFCIRGEKETALAAMADLRNDFRVEIDAWEAESRAVRDSLPPDSVYDGGIEMLNVAERQIRNGVYKKLADQ